MTVRPQSDCSPMVAAQGGPADLLDKASVYLPPAPVIRPVYPLSPRTRPLR